MTAFAVRCYTYGTAEAAQRIQPTPKSRDNYVECRDALLALGLARWRNEANHSAGWDIETGSRAHVADDRAACALIRNGRSCG